jgi:hypothetical protein
MNAQVPNYLTAFVLGGTLAAVVAILLGVNRGLNTAGWPDQERGRAFRNIGTLIMAWLLAALVPSWLEFYHGTASRIPTIQYGLLIPIVVGIALFRRWAVLRRVIEAIPQEWIVGVQFYRALGVIFLLLYAAGRMPGAFALPAGIGDVLVGLLAPVVGLAYAGSPRNAASWMRTWNLLGIADLVVAVTTGFLTSPSQFQMLALDAPNKLISAFPLVMIPVFLVPLSVLLHLASLWKLRQAETTVGGHVRTGLGMTEAEKTQPNFN